MADTCRRERPLRGRQVRLSNLHKGQPAPRALLTTVATHTCAQSLQSHRTRREEPRVRSFGSTSFSGCHSAARVGSPSVTVCLATIEQGLFISVENVQDLVHRQSVCEGLAVGHLLPVVGDQVSRFAQLHKRSRR